MLFLAGALVFVLHALWYFPRTVDDAFISYRYAQNLAAGHGLVFNPGERVEGYSNFLWVVLVAAGIRLGIDPLLCSKLLGLACGLATLAVVARFAPAPSRSKLDALASFLLATSPPFALWAVGGLETPLYTLLLSVGILGHVRELESGRTTTMFSALPFALAALARPEGSLFFGVAVLHRLVRTRTLKSTLVGLLLFAAVVGPYLAWKSAYFGALLPNTYYAKTAGSFAWIRGGMLYLWEFTRNYGGIAAWCLVAVFLRPRSREVWLRCFLANLVAACFFVLLVGADWMPQFRFLVPVLPLLFLLVQESVREMASLWSDDRPLATALRLPKRAGGPLLAALLLVLSLHNAMLSFLMRDPEHADKYDGLRSQVTFGLTEEGRVVGEWLRLNADPHAVVVLNTAGTIPYYSGLLAIDYDGLTDRQVGRTLHARRHRDYSPQQVVDYVFSRHPDFFVLPPLDLVAGIEDNTARQIHRDDRFRDFEVVPGVGVPSHGLRLYRRKPPGADTTSARSQRLGAIASR
jgi:hypothetical protein